MGRRGGALSPAAERCLGELTGLAAQQSEIERRTEATVRAARRAGAHWQEIADALSVPKATCLYRWGSEDDK